MVSKEQCINNEKQKAICLFILVVDEFSGLPWHVSIFSGKDSVSA